MRCLDLRKNASRGTRSSRWGRDRVQLQLWRLLNLTEGLLKGCGQGLAPELHGLLRRDVFLESTLLKVFILWLKWLLLRNHNPWRWLTLRNWLLLNRTGCFWAGLICWLSPLNWCLESDYLSLGWGVGRILSHPPYLFFSLFWLRSQII